MQDVHCGGMGCHFRVDINLELLNMRHFWPTLKRDVKKFLDGCEVCQRGKGNHKNTSLYTPLPVPDFHKVFEVQNDTSGVAIGGVLLQESSLVVYFNEKLNDV